MQASARDTHRDVAKETGIIGICIVISSYDTQTWGPIGRVEAEKYAGDSTVLFGTSRNAPRGAGLLAPFMQEQRMALFYCLSGK